MRWRVGRDRMEQRIQLDGKRTGGVAWALAAVLFCAGSLVAQTAGPVAAQGRHRAKPRAAKVIEAPPALAPVVPQPPPKPNWPVNDPPSRPSVIWNAQGLEIQATNSSLHQILNEISSTTGAKVEGFGQDERIFGTYGPGQARDVLSQLLTGSGYNVLMLGDMGQGAPRQITLSSRTAGAAEIGQPQQPKPSGGDDDSEPAPEQPEEQQPMQPQFNRAPMLTPPGTPERTPQERMQDMQRQQMEMQRQQQQQLQQMQQQQQNPQQ